MPVCEPSANASIASANPAAWLFNTSGFPQRWECGAWASWLGWLHIVSDVLIWGAYMAIPIALALIVRNRPMPMPTVAWLFVAFIATCGIGHLIEAIIFWQPIYRFAGVWKAIIAAVSWATVFALIPVIPRILKWPTLEQVNARLCTEIEERKCAEAQLEQIVNAAPVGMLMVDKNGLIILANVELERTLGYQPAELIGSRLDKLVPEHAREQHPRFRESFFEAPSSRRMGGDRELFAKRKDGTEIPVDIGLTPICNAKGMFVLATVVDVTEQKRTEDKLVKLNASLAEKNSELEQFVYTASHDLKSPLVTMQGYAGLLKQDLDRGRHDRLDQHVKRISDATGTLRNTIDDLLEISRISRSARTVDRINVASLLESVLQSLEGPIAKAGAKVEIDHNLPEIWMDHNQLVHVLQNLITNAIKYGHAPEQPAHITISGEKRDTSTVLSVSDRGPGIDERYRDRVFGLFQRLSSEGEGTGVGLAIVKRIAEMHGGEVWVETNQHGGATFCVAAPNVPNEMALASAA